MKTSIDNLEHLTKCPVCNKAYGETKALLLEVEKDRSTFHISCDNCKTASIVYVTISQLGMMSVGMLCDLDKSEAKRLFKKETITTDQVIAVHEYLKNF